MSWNLGQTGDVRVHVEAHGRLGVSEPAGELDGLHPTLMPEGGAAVSEAVGTESGSAHRVTDTVTVADAERQRLLESFDKEAWGLDDSAETLPLGEFPSYAYLAADGVHIRSNKGERFTHTGTELFHNENGESVAALYTFQNPENVVCIGRLWFYSYRSWKLHPPVAGDVDGDVGEVQHHAELRDEETDGAGFVAVESADPFRYVTDADLVDGDVAERVEQHGGSEAVAVQGSLGDAAAGSKPFRMYVTERGDPDYGVLDLHLRVEPSRHPVGDKRPAYEGFFACPECSTVFDLRVPASAAVADVPSSAVPGVSDADVKGRQ